MDTKFFYQIAKVFERSTGLWVYPRNPAQEEKLAFQPFLKPHQVSVACLEIRHWIKCLGIKCFHQSLEKCVLEGVQLMFYLSLSPPPALLFQKYLQPPLLLCIKWCLVQLIHLSVLNIAPMFTLLKRQTLPTPQISHHIQGEFTKFCHLIDMQSNY